MKLNSKTKRNFAILGTCTLALSFLAVVVGNNSLFSFAAAGNNNQNCLILSTSNSPTDGYVKTVNGNNIYVKSDGVTWDNGSNLEFSNGAYIQTLTIIHGIQSVSVELVSGSLDLYHGYVEPMNLENPMYGSDYSFNTSATYIFNTDYPNRIRLRASESTVVSKITINYDCYSTDVDINEETLDDGLENSYIDAGKIGANANTSYVLDTSSNDSSRALKLDFKGVSNYRVSLSTQKNQIQGLASDLPDFTNAVVTLKAKFSDNIENRNILVEAVGTSWAHSEFVTMDGSEFPIDGWYDYSFDFNDISFADKDSIIRLYFKFSGINSGNKSSAYVILDEIDYHYHTKNQEMNYESVYDGLENMYRDTGPSMENVYVSFDNKVKYGRISRTSLLLRPKESMGSSAHYYVSFSPEAQPGFSTSIVTDLSKGSLMFEYKPINVKNPSTIYLYCYESWSNHVLKTVTTSQLKNGWYRFNYDLSGFGFTSPEMIRIRIGFDVDSSMISKAKFYLDNLRVNSQTREDYTLSLENLDQDGGMSIGCDRSVDFNVTANSASLNSMKCVINGNDETRAWQNKYGMIHVLYESQVQQMTCNTGILECKFLFSGNFPTKKLWLTLVDANWKYARIKDIETFPLGNGWYQLSLDFSTLPTWSGDKSVSADFDFSCHPIRIGFGYQDLNANNLLGNTVWIDDMFYYPETSSGSAPVLWQAYDTENIRRDDSVIADRNITSSNPLSFSDARNGTDSSQLMIKATSNISSYSFRPGTLRGSNGDTLSAACFETLVAKYLYCGTNTNEYNKTLYMGTGYYPDALVPIDRIITANENTVTSGQQQALWINCKIPEDQTPGTYTGYGILNIDGMDYTIPMQVIVYNVTLSGANHNKTIFMIWYEKVQLAESVYDRTMRETYYNFLISKGVSSDHNHDWDKWTIDDMNEYDSFADNFANYIAPNDKISAYRIPVEATQASITGYLTALANRNKIEWDKGNHYNFFDKAIIYLMDEPSNPTWSNTEPQAWKDCKTIQTYIKNAQSAIASSLSGYPEILNGLNNIRNVVTIGCDNNRIMGSGIYKNLLTTDYVGTPCPQFSRVDSSSDRNEYLSRFNNAWFYGCVNPESPYPSYHMDTPLIGQRLITWMQYDYGFEGSLYYCTNMYTKSDVSSELRDVWTDPVVGNCAGDGMLMYPGTRYNIYGPITSMRLENIRNSMEDYEYFYLMDQNIDKYNANTGAHITSCRDLLTGEYTKMFSGSQLLSRGHTSSSGYKAEDFEFIRKYLLLRLEYCY